MSDMRTIWPRARRGRPCPVCGRPDWCLVAADGSAAICARIESARRCGEAGWLHQLRDTGWRPARRNVRSVSVPLTNGRPDLADLAAMYRQALDQARLDVLARSLGLSVVALEALSIGWAATYGAWSFPMTDAAGNVLGIRLRRPEGGKFAVRGGKEGLFLPANVTAHRQLLITEGPTDTAALLDLGYSNVAGRPSCTGGIRLVCELVRQRRPAEVVIVADNDGPGQCGGANLASVLLAYVPVVRVVAPPAGVKDAREWLRRGGTRVDVAQAIAAAPARRLVVRAAITRE